MSPRKRCTVIGPSRTQLALLTVLKTRGAMRTIELYEACRPAAKLGAIYVEVRRLVGRKYVARHRMVAARERPWMQVPQWRITPRGRTAIRAMKLLEAA